MREVIKYIAIDSSEFDVKKECENYELLIIEVDNIMCELNCVNSNKKHDGFELGKSYIQQDKEVFLRVRKAILIECQKYIDHHWIKQTIEDVNIDPSFVSRIIGEHHIKTLSHAWYRISCVDENFQEWCQMYFVKNPNYEAIQLNK